MKETQNRLLHKVLWFWLTLILSVILIVLLFFMIYNHKNTSRKINSIENKSNIYKRNAKGYRDEILSKRTVKPQDSNYNVNQEKEMVSSLNKYLKVDNGLDVTVSNIDTSDLIAFNGNYGSGTTALIVHIKVENNTGKAVSVYPGDFDVSSAEPDSSDLIILDSITNENGVNIETSDNILVNSGTSGGLNLIFANDSSSNKYNVYYLDGIWNQK